MLRLNRYRRNVPIPPRSLFFRRCTRDDSTIPAIETDAAHVVVNDGGVVNVVNVRDVYVADSTVIEKVSVIPPPALKAHAEIAIAVIDPAIEANVRTPVAVVEYESVAAPAPVCWRPQKPDFRTKRLLIDRQRRRPNRNSHANLRQRCCRNGQHDQQEHQSTNETNMHCGFLWPIIPRLLGDALLTPVVWMRADPRTRQTL